MGERTEGKRKEKEQAGQGKGCFEQRKMQPLMELFFLECFPAWTAAF